MHVVGFQSIWILILGVGFAGHAIGIQIENEAPVPDVPLNTDTARIAREVIQPGESKLSESYLPAVMQAVAYYVELIQYEPLHTTTVEPPFTLSASGVTDAVSTTTYRPTYVTQPTTTRWTTTYRPFTTTTRFPTTTARPTTTTYRPWNSYESTTQQHKPGQFAPHSPPRPLYDEVISGPVQNNHISIRPTTTRKPFVAQVGPLPILSISNSQYFDWYTQNKGKQIQKDPEYELQFLHPLPSGLLLDILYEPYEQPSLSDADNINEFRRLYDDFYGRAVSDDSQTGKKRVPPTKPYVQFLMLYDLLKREAKRLMLQKFEGYSQEMLVELNETTNGSAERQLYMLMYKMLQQGEVDKADIKSRVQGIMDDLVNPYSVTAKALRYLKPLSFDL